MKIILYAIVFFIFASQTSLMAQAEKVRTYLKMVALGRIDEVKSQLPDLLAEYPDDAGVLLLHGVVIEDAFRALEIYKEIVKKYPESEWADDAYWRIVQFYAVTGDTIKAKAELMNYRKLYPTSEFLIAATDVVRAAISNLKNNGRKEIYHPSEKTEPDVPNKTTQTGKPAQPKAAVSAEVVTQPKKEPEKTGDRYGLQVGVYSTKEAAMAEKTKYLNQRLMAEVVEKNIDGEQMYAVIIGDYSSKERAEEAKTLVRQQCKCTPIILKK